MSLKNATMTGVFWNSLSQYSVQISKIALTMILARILIPSQFGLIAMITVFSGFSKIIIDFGFGKAIVQADNPSDDDLSSIFWLNIIIGIVLAVLLSLSSPLIADFFGESILIPLTCFIALTYIFDSANVVQNALFVREMDFKKLGIPKVISVIIGGIVAILLALKGFGVWALAVQIVLTALLNLLFIWIISSWRPTLFYSFNNIKNYLYFSFSLFLNSSLDYVAKNIDNFIIGKNFGQTQLGLYSKSYSFISLPSSNISKILTNVLFPSFSKIKNDKKKVGLYYINIVKTVCIASFPLMLLIFFYSEEFVHIVLGEKWKGAIPFVQIFCFSGIIASINTLLGSIITSQGRTDLILKEAYLKRPLLIIFILIGSLFSVLAVAIGKLLADLLNLFVTFYQIKSAIEIGVKKQLISLSKIVMANIIFLSYLYITDIILLPTELLKLSVIVSGSILYLIAIYFFEKPLVKEILNTLRFKFE